MTALFFCRRRHARECGLVSRFRGMYRLRIVFVAVPSTRFQSQFCVRYRVTRPRGPGAVGNIRAPCNTHPTAVLARPLGYGVQLYLCRFLPFTRTWLTPPASLALSTRTRHQLDDEVDDWMCFAPLPQTTTDVWMLRVSVTSANSRRPASKFASRYW